MADQNRLHHDAELMKKIVVILIYVLILFVYLKLY